MTPLVEEGLKAITERTNLSSGLSHPNDMNAAKEMFVRLHQADEILLAAEISAWASAHGWKEEDADELGALAQQIGMGKNVHLDDKSWWREDILSTLQARAT